MSLSNFYDPKPPQFLKTGININWERLSLTEPMVIPVSSSAISQIYHNPITETTEVYFTDGSEYEYDGISTMTILEWIQSSSIGRYFNYHIRDRYSYSQIA